GRRRRRRRRRSTRRSGDCHRSRRLGREPGRSWRHRCTLSGGLGGSGRERRHPDCRGRRRPGIPVPVRRQRRVHGRHGREGGSGSVVITYTPPAVGPPTSFTLFPAAVTLSAGQSQAYGAEAFDVYHDDLGDVTTSTVFTIEGGSCSANVCSSLPAGSHTVTAS